jgi:hypothetical protein
MADEELGKAVANFLLPIGLQGDEAHVAGISGPDAMGAYATPQLAGPDQTTADKALDKLATMFRDLQLQANRIFQLFGSSVPCDIIGHHNTAVAAYYQAAKVAFQDLTSKGYTVVQKLYNLEGKESGQQKGPIPVAPTYFSPCKGQAQPIPSAIDGALGTGQPVISVGSAEDFSPSGLGVLPVVAWIAIALIAGGTTVAVVHTIVVNLPSQPVAQVKAQGEWMNNYLSCVERLAKSTPGGAPAADKTCRGLTPPPPAPDGGSLGLALVILAVVGGGGYLIYRAARKSGRFAALGPSSSEPAASAAVSGADDVGDVGDVGDTIEEVEVVGGDDLSDAGLVETLAPVVLGDAPGGFAGARAGVNARFRGCLCP